MDIGDFASYITLITSFVSCFLFITKRRLVHEKACQEVVDEIITRITKYSVPDCNIVIELYEKIAITKYSFLYPWFTPVKVIRSVKTKISSYQFLSKNEKEKINTMLDSLIIELEDYENRLR